jgi:hypothetical protein
MSKVDKYTWTAELTPPPAVTITYGYNRNGVSYETSDEINLSDTLDNWHKQRSVKANINEQVVQKDEVKKWRWMDNQPITAKLLTDTTQFQPRVNGAEFQKGLAVIDYWWNIFRENGETEATAQRILNDNANYVEYSPTWTIDVTDEKITLNKTASYAYPDDAIHYEVKAAKAVGLKVIFRNQIWMDLSAEQITKPRSATFWDSYFQTRHDYLLEIAKFAAADGVDAISIGSDSDTLNAFTAWGSAPSDSIARLVQDIREVRKVYSGKLYYDFTPSGLSGDSYDIDWQKWQPVLNEVNFIGISDWKGISNKSGATLNELVKDAGNQFDQYFKSFFDKTKKPVVFIGLAFPSAEGGSTGKYSVNSREIDVWKPDDGTPNDFQEQADVYEAIMRAVAERPWIIGVYSFGFWRHDQQDKGYNIRGKPAEQVIKKWYGVIN